SDGVAGLAAIREAGGVTYGQDEASSVIYGMNRVAVERGAVQRTLPLGDIAGAMAAAARGFGGGAA
ncbi:MAG TPA: chemotaxis protein CheB, partial [Rhodocyclaceae bacterium]|nr:chemotaxis protein CheB [Rhodocyclaceae bacterium]